MRTGLVGSVGRLCGSALCGGHRGDGAALAGRRGRVVCRLLCRKMGGGARGARIRCSEGGRRCWRCGGMAWGRWRMRTTEYTSGDVRANLGGHPAPRPPGDRRHHDRAEKVFVQGARHGKSTVATHYAPPSAPAWSLDHCPVPTTYWDDYPPMETLHGRAQPRQDARGRA